MNDAIQINRRPRDFARVPDFKVQQWEFMQQLTMADSVAAAAETAVDYVASAVAARRVSVMVAENGELRIAASRGVPSELAKHIRVPLDHGVSGQVFASGKAMVFEDVVRERPELALGLANAGASASLPLVSAPMGVGKHIVGCVNATDKPGGAFSSADLCVITFAANAAGIAISAQQSSRKVEQANYDTIRCLALAVEAKDAYTHGHSLRVQAWAVAIGRELGFSDDRLHMLSIAGELHDTGKLAVPDAVLHAPRGLSESEWALVRQHPACGVRMIEHIRFLQDALPAILHHHERLDGRGYPSGLSGEAIPLEARILAVVDAYDAMTSVRPYRESLSHAAAAEELRRGAGVQFDACCVETFLRLLGDTLDPSGRSLAAGVRNDGRPAMGRGA